MSDLKISIVIPYRQRLDNLRAVFASLAAQSMDPAEFEVVVGALEYDPEYTALCREYTGRLRIVSVLSEEEWNTSRARNLGIGQARGRVTTVLDADVVLARDALANLYDHHFRHGQNVCVLGQILGYDEAADGADAGSERPSPEHCERLLERLDAAERARLDPRWSAEYASAFARFPWAFARTGFMALPTATVNRHGLLLDEGFRGWGPEDQEWGLRIARTGTPLVLGQDVVGLHLPHRRDMEAQERSATAANRHYLANWPRLELEAALAFGGWLEADRRLPDIERELKAAGGPLGVLSGTAGSAALLVVGAELDGRGRPADPGAVQAFEDPSGPQVLPLAGFALPFDDAVFDECRLLAPVARLSEPYRTAILREAERVARTPVPPPQT
ncbi:glycosyltransferase family 2 protein [Nocardiopsis baichengensis]|uniref:glycosyltransferase family 2 protein n=1 Tax=Nocardiopsis baichengensis TaxID=280240 RepID=UPI0003453F54|nr:glycosyltransferase family 2 protein [Nocardiopsis baichengensis]